MGISDAAAESPESPQAVADAATRITWWAVLGTLLSMSAAVAGALVGSGQRLRLLVVEGMAFQRHPLGRNQPVVRS